MISPISFTSRFTIQCKTPEQRTHAKKYIATLAQNATFKNFKSESSETNQHLLYAVMPDEYDHTVHTYCSVNRIKYTQGPLELRYPEFWKKIDIAPKDCIKVNINPDTMEFLGFSKKSNYSQCEEKYNKYKLSRLEKHKIPLEYELLDMVASKIPASKLTIRKDAHKKGDKKIINFDSDEKISISPQETIPSYYVYFALKDAGLKRIPVYVPKDDFELVNYFFC